MGECVPIFLDNRYIIYSAEWPVANASLFVYDAGHERWIVSEPFDVRKRGAIRPDRVFQGTHDIWIAENYTLYKIPSIAPVSMLQEAEPEQILHEYFDETSWEPLTIEETEIRELARHHKIYSLGIAIVETDNAVLYAEKNGEILGTIPFGTCVFVYKWFGGRRWWQEPQKALVMYAKLMQVDSKHNVYMGTVPAWAAYQRAGLLQQMKRSQEVLQAYREVISRYGDQYWPSGMYSSASYHAIASIKEICLEELHSSDCWKKELVYLQDIIKNNNDLLEFLNYLATEK